METMSITLTQQNLESFEKLVFLDYATKENSLSPSNHCRKNTSQAVEQASRIRN